MKKILICCLIVFFATCTNNEDSSRKITSEEEEEIQNSINNSGDGFVTKAGTNTTKKQWNLLFKKCIANDAFTNPIFLGTSNNNSIGAIYNTKSNRFIDDLVLRIPSADYLKLIKSGVVNENCSVNSEKDLNLQVIIESVFEKIGDVDIKSELKKASKRSISASNWKQIISFEKPLFKYIDTSKIPGMDDYRAALKEKKSFIISGVIEVKAFSAELEYNSDIDMGIAAKIDSAWSQRIDGNGEIKLKISSSRKIKIECSNSFIPLAILSKR